jgi:sigma-E factor negative regulatory protein RseA
MQGAEHTEKLSALMDGELEGGEAAREIARLKQHADRGAWDAYHVIGEVMRGERSRLVLSANFSERLSQRLALEPTVLAPIQHARAPRTAQTYALAAAASVAAVAAVGWMSMTMFKQEPATLARAPAAPAVVAKAPPTAPVLEPVAAAPEHVHEYLLAHQGISPTTAIQGVTPYIRTVSSAGGASGGIR